MNQNYLYDVIWKAICCMNGFMKYEELLYSESAVEVKWKEKLIIMNTSSSNTMLEYISSYL